MPDNDSEPKLDPQTVPLAYERARVIVEQHDDGMLQGDVKAEVAVLVSRAVLTLVELMKADVDELASSHTRCETLEGERDAALKRARAAEAEQLPVHWYWGTTAPSVARQIGSNYVCQANLTGGALQMIGQIPNQVQTACLARMTRLNAERAARDAVVS